MVTNGFWFDTGTKTPIHFDAMNITFAWRLDKQHRLVLEFPEPYRGLTIRCGEKLTKRKWARVRRALDTLGSTAIVTKG